MTHTILLTGASGLLGSEMLRGYLNAADDARVIVLLRDSSMRAEEKFANLVADADARERAQLVKGDVAQPRLGLDERVFRALAERVTDIINSAASIDFALPLDAARAVNVQGVANLIEFARACKNLRAFAHISTAHVAGRRSGFIAEDELDHAAGFVNAYEQSKYEAEQFLRAEMRQLPIAIHRSTSIIGDSRGVVRQFNFFHNALRLLYHNFIPALPGVPDGHIDLIPVDYAARAIRYLVDKNFRAGTTYHICAEPARSFTLQQLLDATIDAFAVSPSSKKRNRQRVSVVDSAAFDQLLQWAETSGDERVRRALVPLSYFLPQLAAPKVFDASHARRDLRGSGIEPPHIRTYLGQVIEYCLQTNWGRPVTP
jgi:thioester reductase-like protein